MGFMVHIKLFGHRVPNKNDTDVGIFSGHQEVLFSKSPDILPLFIMGRGRHSRRWWEGQEQEGFSSPLCPLSRLRNSLSND